MDLSKNNKPSCNHQQQLPKRDRLSVSQRLSKRNQGKSSSTPVTSDLSKTFHQLCLWLHQSVKTKKGTEDSVIYLLGNPQRDIGDWLTLINKLDTIATFSIPTAMCQQQQTTPNHACPCVCACRPEVLPYRTTKNNNNNNNNLTDIPLGKRLIEESLDQQIFLRTFQPRD